MGTMGCDVDSDSAKYSAEALVTELTELSPPQRPGLLACVFFVYGQQIGSSQRPEEA